VSAHALSFAQAVPQRLLDLHKQLFIVVTLLIVCGAIFRSAVATRLDGFTLDEAYHIAAGVSYVRDNDFRINPEHPPLVKLWVGGFISSTGFHLSSLRPFADKYDERAFAEQDVYLHNDFDSVQRRARIAMWTLNGLLLTLFAFAVRRVFGFGVAIGALLFLAIDPTVAAHLPVVMTDLPVSLLSATAVVLATRAFYAWAWGDLIAGSIVLGLVLAAKHSALVFLVFIVFAGTVLALTPAAGGERHTRLNRLGKLATVIAIALIVLWSVYGFRSAESNHPAEVFNRPLATKITDLRSPAYRLVISAMARSHVAPRAYIWGLADTVRAGLEGRADPVFAFGRSYFNAAPMYFFPGVLALKAPIGSSILVLLGLWLYSARRLPGGWRALQSMVLAAAVFFLLVLMRGVTYGGIRHALPIVVLLSVFAGTAAQYAMSSDSKRSRMFAAIAFAAAALSAIPIMRPWEYFNEIIGGPSQAYHYFNDEGVDLLQRGTEAARYYHTILEPTGELPLFAYTLGPEVAKYTALNVDWLGRDFRRDESRIESTDFAGTVMVNARLLAKMPFWDIASLRDRTPDARFGNLLIFRGPCSCESLRGQLVYTGALARIYSETPDLPGAERLLRESIRLDPSPFFAYIDLGNLLLKRGAREDALRTYSEALKRVPGNPEISRAIEEQITRVSSEPLDRIPELRDPFLE
jgi:tetratricopeptide (TPR) repeat protein